MRDVIIRGARAHFIGHINKHLANIEIYMNNTIGIGEHSDIIETVDDKGEKLLSFPNNIGLGVKGDGTALAFRNVSDSKGNRNASDTTADETNSIGHSFTFGHDFILTEIISTSIGLGYSDSDAKVDAGNDYETYDFSFGLNFAFPWA